MRTLLQWTTEEKVLLDIIKIIAAAWRMNGRQLHDCFRKLQKKWPEILPGSLGWVFLKKLDELSALEQEERSKIWPALLQDADWLLNLMQKYPNLDEAVWRRALSRLEAQQGKTFRTELGRAFIAVLKEKLAMDARPSPKELEAVADWLMEKPARPQEKEHRKCRRLYAVFPDRAIIIASACMSVCFLFVWLYGQVERNQSFHDVQSLRAASVSQLTTDTAGKQENGEYGYTDIETDQAVSLGRRDAVAASGQKNGTVLDGQPDKRPVDARTSGKGSVKRPKILPQYQEMAKEYPGLFGWLQVPDTQIDLPVMQPLKEKDFYLDHDFTGAVSAEGALFTDPQNNRWPQDGNTVIYGHNMKNGHIFGGLDLYEDADYFQAHREIYFDTIYETGVYEAIAVLKTRILKENEQGFRYYQFFRYDNEKEFQECLDFVTANQLFDTGSSLQYEDKILMLSTCEYSQENGRLVVVARKIEKRSR